MRTLILIAAFLAGCSQEPVEIHYGSDECTHCRMMISDERFASQIVTETGKSLKFDSAECLAEYSGDHKDELTQSKFWVSDFSGNINWVEVKQAVFVRSEVVKSPMGAGLLAFDKEESAQQHLSEFPGEVVLWSDLVK
jgi:copper chaperone NosL